MNVGRGRPRARTRTAVDLSFDTVSNEELELLFRQKSPEQLQRMEVAFREYVTQARRRGPEVEAFYVRRLELVMRLLEEQGQQP